MSTVADRFPSLTATAARDRTLPVHFALGALVPHLQRGTTIGCEGAAALTLALVIAAGPSRAGAWVGVAGLAGLGAAAAAECDIALERLVLVAAPGAAAGRSVEQMVGGSGGSAGESAVGAGERWGDQRWGEVLAAMIDGFDVVVVGAGAWQVRSGTARRLQARAHTRGAVLVVAGAQQSFGCDLHLRSEQPVWVGLGRGHGVARARRVQVEAGGRRLPRTRRAEVWLPAEHGRPAPVVPGVAVPGVAVPGVDVPGVAVPLPAAVPNVAVPSVDVPGVAVPLPAAVPVAGGLRRTG